MRTSAVGINAIRRREGVALHYCNDLANNCACGIGISAHLGPCTPDELRRPVTEAEVNRQLAVEIQSFERSVRSQVKQTKLTQQQFDALVSFAFNVGPRGARRVLEAANKGDMSRVANLMGGVCICAPAGCKWPAKAACKGERSGKSPERRSGSIRVRWKTVMKCPKIIMALMICVYVAPSFSQIDNMNCKKDVGGKKSATLVNWCLMVSPATRPPCNSSNSCELIVDEIKRGCKIVGDQKDAPTFCLLVRSK